MPDRLDAIREHLATDDAVPRVTNGVNVTGPQTTITMQRADVDWLLAIAEAADNQRRNAPKLLSRQLLDALGR